MLGVADATTELQVFLSQLGDLFLFACQFLEQLLVLDRLRLQHCGSILLLILSGPISFILEVVFELGEGVSTSMILVLYLRFSS